MAAAGDVGFVRRSQQVPALRAAVKSDAFHVSNVLSIGRQLSGEELLGGDLKDPGKLREQSGVRKTGPRSHLEMVRSLKCSSSASCFWVSLCSRRRERISGPVFQIHFDPLVFILPDFWGKSNQRFVE